MRPKGVVRLNSKAVEVDLQMRRKLRLIAYFTLLCVLSSPFAAYGQEQKVSLGIPCTVTVDVGSHGKVYTNNTTYTGAVTGSFKVEPGTLVTFRINPDSGYEVSTLTLSGSNVRSKLRDGVYSVTIDKDETLVVRFSKKTTTTTPTPESTPPSESTPTPDPTGGTVPSESPSSGLSGATGLISRISPQTGDDNIIEFWIAMMLISIIVLLILLFQKDQ